MTFFALCVTEEGPAIRRMQLTNPVQQRMTELFHEQEIEFRADVAEEVPFSGDWKPDEDELLTIEVGPDAGRLVEAVIGNPLAVPALESQNFQDENIKALFTGRKEGTEDVVLCQRFIASQILNRKPSFILSDNVFKELTEPSFTLGTSLTCIIEGGSIKFDSFHKLRMIFDVSHLYRQATDGDLEDFADCDRLNIPDVDGFKLIANQTIRKLVHKIMQSSVLEDHTAAQIRTKAQAVGLNLTIANNQIEMPVDARDVRQLLRFLDDSLYEAELSGQRYVTNSKRLV